MVIRGEALLLFLRGISSILSQGVTGCDSSLLSFCYSRMLLHFAFIHLRSGYYYYDYVVIGVQMGLEALVTTIITTML